MKNTFQKFARSATVVLSILLISLALGACASGVSKITVKNTFEKKDYLQSGIASSQVVDRAPIPNGVLVPNNVAADNSVTIEFFGNENSYLDFVTMYGWSTDFFFAPDADTANAKTLGLGIPLYEKGMPRGEKAPVDVTAEIKVYDNGTKVNQTTTGPVENGPAENKGFANPVADESKNIELAKDAANKVIAAAGILKAELNYNKATNMFALTVTNVSENNMNNKTPLSPVFWAVLQKGDTPETTSAPLFALNAPSTPGITDLAQTGGAGGEMASELSAKTGVYTPISPVLVVVYDNTLSAPVFTEGQPDQGQGLANIAQMGDASMLQTYFDQLPGVTQTYLLGSAPIFPGEEVSSEVTVTSKEKLAIVTMYGFSTDWFFGVQDLKAKKGTFTLDALYDSGTQKNQFPGVVAKARESESEAISAIAPDKATNGFADIPASKVVVTFN